MILAVLIPVIFTLFCITVNGMPKCGPNEEWVRCAGCELSCDDTEPIACFKKCFPPQCQCIKDSDKDFRRNKDGKCVPANECP